MGIKDYRILSSKNMEELTKFWWDKIIRSEFPNSEYPLIHHKREIPKKYGEYSVGMAMFKRKTKALEISYVLDLYNGKYKFKYTEAVVVHEILHCYDYIKIDKSDHSKRFIRLLKRYDSCMGGIFVNNPEEEIYSNNPNFIKIFCNRCGQLMETTSKEIYLFDLSELNSNMSTDCCNSGFSIKFNIRRVANV